MSMELSQVVGCMTIFAFFWGIMVNGVMMASTMKYNNCKAPVLRRYLPFSYISTISVTFTAFFMILCHFHPEIFIFNTERTYCLEWYLVAILFYLIGLYLTKIGLFLHVTLLANPDMMNEFNNKNVTFFDMLDYSGETNKCSIVIVYFICMCIGVTVIQFESTSGESIIDLNSDYDSDSTKLQFEHGCNITFTFWNGLIASLLVAFDMYFFTTIIRSRLLKIKNMIDDATQKTQNSQKAQKEQKEQKAQKAQKQLKLSPGGGGGLINDDAAENGRGDDHEDNSNNTNTNSNTTDANTYTKPCLANKNTTNTNKTS